MYGKTWSEEQNQLMSIRMSGENNPMYGVPSPMKGKSRSEEHNRKLREAWKRRKEWKRLFLFFFGIRFKYGMSVIL